MVDHVINPLSLHNTVESVHASILTIYGIQKWTPELPNVNAPGGGFFAVGSFAKRRAILTVDVGAPLGSRNDQDDASRLATIAVRTMVRQGMNNPSFVVSGGVAGMSHCYVFLGYVENDLNQAIAGTVASRMGDIAWPTLLEQLSNNDFLQQNAGVLKEIAWGRGP